jgi:hypothetical protein
MGRFGDIYSLTCNDGSPPFGPKMIACGADGTWTPDQKLTPTRCNLVACPPLKLDVTVAYFKSLKYTASNLTSNISTAPKSGCDPRCVGELTQAIAPALYSLSCAEAAVMLMRDESTDGKKTLSAVGTSPLVQCAADGQWKVASTD